MKLVCIVCPNGCAMEAKACGGEITVSGNKCPRGADFARAELTCPLRTVCSTVRTVFPETPVISVRVDREIPKARIFDVMRELNKVTVTHRLSRGDIVIENVLGLGADVIVTTDILKD